MLTKKKDNTDRNERIFKMAGLGFTQKAMGEQFNLTPARIGQIVKKMKGVLKWKKLKENHKQTHE